MKKILLSIICLLACIISIKAQTLYGTTSRGGSGGGGTINKFIPATNDLTVAKSFEGLPFFAPLYTNFLQANNGKLYGVTPNGTSFYGNIFSFDPLTSTYTNLMDFHNANGAYPSGGLIQASDGKLYGMTIGGGSNGVGVIYSFDLSSSTYTQLKDFENGSGSGAYGSLMQAIDGKLYGMTNGGGSNGYGVIFSFDPSTSIYTKLVDFDNTVGGSPFGGLIQAKDGKLYGMTSIGGSNGAGVIFSFDPSSSAYTNLKDFDYANGAYPYGTLIQASDGNFYGMTVGGGNNGSGVIFSFDNSSSTYTKLKDFDYTDGAGTYGSLFQATDGNLYGLTAYGGSSGAGTIFSFDPSGSIYTKLKDFDFTDGGGALGSLIQASDGKLYGMTNGQLITVGIIFSFDPFSSTYAKLKDFNTNETGSNVSGSLVRASDGKLYGLTNKGGSNGYGVIFSYEPSASTYTKLKDFDNINGSNPNGSLIQASNGKLYGLTSGGGSGGAGVIFSFDPSTSIYTKLKDFDYSIDGGYSNGGLLQASDGKLYGMTGSGGSSGLGVIFSFDPTASIYTKLIDFDYTNGGVASGSLIQASDGMLYGMTNNGGNGLGVIFSFDPVDVTYKKLVDFDNAKGAFPGGSLIQASDGKLYGMTPYGGSGEAGVFFSFHLSTSTYTNLKDFDNINGGNPQGSLMQANDGKLYGMTSSGGSSSAGVIFSFDLSTSTYTKLTEYDGANGANPSMGAAFIEVNDCVANTIYYQDTDGDSYGDFANSTTACSQPAGYVSNNTDCDDANPAIYPGATEVCNGRDDDCDGLVDEGFTDTDGDHITDCVDPDDDNDGVPDFKDCAPLDKKNDKVLICHKGNTLCVSQNAVAAHLKHGDTEGPCSSNPITSASRGNTEVTNDLEANKSNLTAPAEYSLSNYPNPFVGASTIKYTLPFDSKVAIKVYDLMGRVVATLVDEGKSAGTYTVDFSAGHSGKGSLYYRITATSKNKQFKKTNKMIQLP